MFRLPTDHRPINKRIGDVRSYDELSRALSMIILTYERLGTSRAPDDVGRLEDIRTSAKAKLYEFLRSAQSLYGDDGYRLAKWRWPRLGQLN